MAETRDEKAARLRAKEQADKERHRASVARRQQHERRTAKIERAAETRRDIVVGKRLRADNSPEAQALLGRYVGGLTHPQDIALFALSPAMASETGFETGDDARVKNRNVENGQLGYDEAISDTDGQAAWSESEDARGIRVDDRISGDGETMVATDDVAMADDRHVMPAADLTGEAADDVHAGPRRDTVAAKTAHPARVPDIHGDAKTANPGESVLRDSSAERDPAGSSPSGTAASTRHAHESGVPFEPRRNGTVPSEITISDSTDMEGSEHGSAPVDVFAPFVFETPFDTRDKVADLDLGIERATLDDGRWGAFAETPDQYRALVTIGLTPIGLASSVKRKRTGKLRR